MAVDEKLASFMTDADEEGSDSVKAPANKEPEYEPQYVLLGAEKIPVSKKLGAIWKSRRDAGVKKIKDAGDDDRWETALRYYRADHQDRRDNSDVATDKDQGVTLATKGLESENIVFANTSALVPATYAKNPKIEITCEGRKDLEDFASTLKKLVNLNVNRKGVSGLNLKKIARRCVVMAHLTNIAYVEVGYTKRDQTDANTQDELQKIAKKLADSKTTKKEIQQLEARLQVIDRRIDVMQPSGPFIKFRDPRNVVIDPDCDLIEEARWIMYSEFLANEFILEMYGKINDDGTYDSIYQPTHVLKVGTNGEGEKDPIDEQIASFRLFDTSGEKTAKDYGFDSDDAFQKAKHTKVWYVWDKATRRMYLFNDAEWKYPLWVWNDPYGYDTFFPIEPLEFYTDPSDYHARSEVSYYLDQQDGLNAINNEVAKAREFIVGKMIYNISVLGNDHEKIVGGLLDGTNRKRAIGVDLPPDTDLSKAMVPLAPASAHALQTTIFDRDRIIQSINRVSSVTDVMRGVEYKTNTTNKAIESYESNTQARLDEKIDAIEDFIGAIGWKLAQLFITNLEADDVREQLGDEHATVWEDKIDEVRNLKHAFNVTCVGGSTLKPTSANKKNQAAQIGQILGQFARSTPAAVLVALKVMERAYDEVIIEKADWDMIMQGVQSAMQQASSAPSGGQGDKPREGSAPGNSQQGQPDPAEGIKQLLVRINGLPMSLKIELAKAIASNVPIEQAIQQVLTQMAAADGAVHPDQTGA